MTVPKSLKTKVFADGADLETARTLAADPLIRGFTTNPTLMRKAGVNDYERFARLFLERVGDRPVSFEVVSDELKVMREEAHLLSSWGDNVYVKIPVTTTRAASTAELVRDLSGSGVQVNVTAVFTLAQVERAAEALADGASAVVSILAGRIADTGRDPVPVISEALDVVSDLRNVEILWASPREVLNLVQASEIGCHIITVTPDLLGKLHLLGKGLEEFSLETVTMFHEDARAAGLGLGPPTRPRA